MERNCQYVTAKAIKDMAPSNNPNNFFLIRLWMSNIDPEARFKVLETLQRLKSTDGLALLDRALSNSRMGREP
jgi:hypothetical protein